MGLVKASDYMVKKYDAEFISFILIMVNSDAQLKA